MSKGATMKFNEDCADCRRDLRQRRKLKVVHLDAKGIRALAHDATVLAAAVKLYVDASISGPHRLAADRILKKFLDAPVRRSKKRASR